MKKMLTMFVCLLLATVAFGQWDMVKGPFTFDAPTDAATLSATSVLTVDGDVVKKTIDFGVSWTEILLPEGVTMRQIDAANATVAYTCGNDGLIYKTVDAGETWTQVGDTSQFVIDLKEIDVLDTNTVFISGKAGWFMKTVDGGTTWDTTIVGDEDLDGGVAFATATNGIVFADGNSGVIWTTTDGGDSWTAHPMTPPFGIVSKRMYGASAAAPSTFVVSAYHNVIYLSTDGGANWALTGDYTYAYERGIDVECFDANNFMVFTSETNVFTTSNGGTNWDTLSVGTGQTCKTNAFTSLTNGLIWSSYGQEYSTVDGSTFVPLHDWPGISFYGIAFPAEDKIALSATFGGEFTMSTDNGVTFPYPTNVATKATSSIYKAEFIDENTGIMGGSSGLILKTIDGGDTWTVIDNFMAQGTNLHINMLHVAPNDDIFAGGSKGNLMKSTNDGDTWTEVESASGKTVYDMCVFSNGMAMLGQSSGQFSISKSTALDTFELVADYGSMSFREIKERNGVILVAASDAIYKTTIDDIDTLIEAFDVPGGNDMYCVEFIDDSLVYAAGQYGLVYRSYDAGETWEQVLTGANKTIQGLRYNGDKLWAIGQEGIIMSLDILEDRADYSETFESGSELLPWAENTINANSGGLNLTIYSDPSAGNVGRYVDDAYTGLLYANTGRKLSDYEVSADIYIVKEQDATEALYKGLVVKCDPEEQLFYRFVYRNSTSSNGQIRLQGFDGVDWYISKYFNPGVDFDTLETGFHNFKAQVIDNKFWLYIDGDLLPGCPYTHDGDPVVEAGYPGIYKYNGGTATVTFDNFNVNVYGYPKYMVTAHVNMSIQIRNGNFTHAGHSLDVMGSFNGWSGGVPMTDANGDSVYSADLGEHEFDTNIQFKCRRNGAWDDTEEFPKGGPNRSYDVLDGDNDIPVFYYSDVTEVAVAGVPDNYELAQNYPNPFNPTTTLKFAIPNNELVTLSVYNVAGRKVAELVNEHLDAGYYNVNFNAGIVLPSGVYIYRLTAGEFISVKKMTLLK